MKSIQYLILKYILVYIFPSFNTFYCFFVNGAFVFFKKKLLSETQHNHVGVNVYFFTFIERKYITLQSSGDQITAQCSPDESNTAKNNDKLGLYIYK